jgi:ADP-heptose:LPS heptosyltransferase
MYTTSVPRPLFSRPCHSVQNQWDLLTPLGIVAPDPAVDSTEMTADPAAAAEIDRRLAKDGVKRGDPVVVIHVSAGNPFRRWPAASFVDLVCRLIATDRRRWIILTSGPSDRDAARRIADAARARLPEAERGAVIHGEFTVAGLRALIDLAALYIGGDSGPLHIASTTQTPIVGLYGPTLSVRSEPWRNPSIATEKVEVGPLPCRPCDQRRCEPGDFRCLSGITAEAVAASAERVWARVGLSSVSSVVNNRR